MSSDEDIRLLGELGNLLEKQIELARRGSLTGLEQLANQCEPLVTRITAAGLLEKSEHKDQRKRLVKLYRDLQLLLSAQKNVAAEQLKLIRKGKKTLAVYRGNV
jgi:small-conductance mechanosensitive channel